MRRLRTMRMFWRAVLGAVLPGVAIGIALLLHLGDAAAQAEGIPPNVVVIMLDDLDVESLDLMVNAGLMPNFKTHILDKGTSFSESFVSNPLCCPSRATYLTGQYAHNHKVISNLVSSGGWGVLWWDLYGDGELDGDFEGENETIAVWMQNAGYRTGYIGKYLNGQGHNTAKDRVPVGWNDWQGLLDFGTYCVYNYSIYDNQEDLISVYGSDGRIRKVRDGQLVEVEVVDDWRDNYQTDVLAQRSVEFISESAGDEPFFLTVMPIAPHTEICDNVPLWTIDFNLTDVWEYTIRPADRHSDTSILPTLDETITPSFNEADLTDKPRWMWDETNIRYRALLNEENTDDLRQQYQGRLGSLRAVDDLIGNVVTELANTGELDNTVIIFTSDNGWFSGEHRLSQKMFAYEEAIRVPLFIVTPGSGQPQSRSEMVLNNDLAPTIAALAGASIPEYFEVDGRSLVPLLDTQAQANWQRKRFLVEHWEILGCVDIWCIMDTCQRLNYAMNNGRKSLNFCAHAQTSTLERRTIAGATSRPSCGWHEVVLLGDCCLSTTVTGTAYISASHAGVKRVYGNECISILCKTPIWSMSSL